MEFGFLFWLFGIGIIVACLQDLKRREVDNWLNLFLFVSGFVFVLIGAILERNWSALLLFGYMFCIMFVLMRMFYHGRVFAGGDAKLLAAMTAFFLAGSFIDSLVNVGVFVFFLLVSGSIYGLVYSGVLYYKNKKEVNKEMRRFFKEKYIVYYVLASVFIMLFGIISSLGAPQIFERWGVIFLIVGIYFLFFIFLFVFAKGLENVSMIRKLSGEELREGDWLVEDVRVGKRVIKASWDGLELEDLKLLKNKKEVLIKEGLPFVPAFLVAFLFYVFLKSWLLGFF